MIDVGTLALIKSGEVTIKKGIERFTETGVVFTDGTEEAYDSVILATGYKSAVEDFIEDTKGLFNELGLPADLWFDHQPGLYFLGFDAYSSGILYSILQSSEKIATHIRQHHTQTEKAGQM